MADYWNDYEQGEVRALKPGQDPPISSLVEAFRGQDVNAADAIVLRGYLGRSDILKRALDYLARAKRVAEAHVDSVAARTLGTTIVERTDLAEIQARAIEIFGEEARAEALARGAEAGEADAKAQQTSEAPDAEITGIGSLITALQGVMEKAEPHVPWRLYLTPRLDTYVDFHRSSLLAYRREAKAERQDACTVWLRIFEDGGRDPIPYRVIHETILGPSFAIWLGGESVDDSFGDSSSGSAWGDQASVFGGGKARTGIYCGRKNTGLFCGE
jgi:hypothetical protein